MPSLTYTSVDLEPGRAQVEADIADLPFPDSAFDLILCSHVLEHVPNDLAALRELGRVVRPAGCVVLQVPLSSNEKTEEDPTEANPVERLRRFGQEDHVRLYGQDVCARIRRSGFDVSEIAPTDLLDARELARFGVPEREPTFLCYPVAEYRPESSEELFTS